ncbi:hypothetical protein D3C78_835490 [compost metagenome]
MNHFFCQLNNPDRLPHVQHKDVTAAAHRPSLDHQLSRFRNSHEVPGYLRMGNRQRTARLDLLVKKRDNRARRAQHIAKTDHRESCFIDLGNLVRIPKQYRCQFTTESLQCHFSQALGTSHDICRPNGFICRDKHEIRNADLQRSLSSVQCANHIVEHAFCNVVLYHGDMLIGCGMIDSVYMPSSHDFIELMLISHRTKNRQQAH